MFRGGNDAGNHFGVDRGREPRTSQITKADVDCETTVIERGALSKDQGSEEAEIELTIVSSTKGEAASRESIDCSSGHRSSEWRQVGPN